MNYHKILLKSLVVLHACVSSLHASDMDKLGRGHFCTQAIEGLMTNKENTSEVFLYDLKCNLSLINILIIMRVFAAFDRRAVFI